MRETLLRERGGRLRVTALTGIRSEYDLLYPLLAAMRRDRAFAPSVIACGAHLTPLHRYSVRLIEHDGFRITARIKSHGLSDSVVDRVKATGRLIAGLGPALDAAAPDLLLVLGDREEALAGAVAAGYMNIPVVHIGGGDDTRPAGGDVDEQARHAATKLSHVHLTVAPEHSARVVRLGEERWRVHTIGNPGLDRLRLEPRLPAAKLARAVGAAALRPYAVVIYHALSSTMERSAAEMGFCLDAALEAGLEVFAGAPNSDPGFRDVLAAVEKRRSHPRLHLYRNLPRAEFTALLRGATVLVGNSSLGLHEAGYLGLPCVNVGERQRGRLAGPNVLFVPGTASAVRAAVRRAAFDPAFRRKAARGGSPYGDGHAVERALRVLKNLPGRSRLLAKRITY